MTDRRELALDPARGVALPLAAYQRDFAERESAVRAHVAWKFERRQYFEERDDPSRDALAEGRWQEALRLLAAEEDRWRAIAADDESRGAPFRRVRVVAEPLTTYLRWELHALAVQAKAGMGVRVVGVERLRALERSGPLPEVVVLGGRVVYEVEYGETGVLEGGRRFLDTELAARWGGFIEALYEQGEDVRSYVERRVAGLPPPSLPGTSG